MNINHYLRLGHRLNWLICKKIINKWIRFVYSCDIPCDGDIHDTVRFGHNRQY